MRSSLRTWLLLVAVLFSALVVGGMALTTYVVVSDGMSVVAHDSTIRLSASSAQVVKNEATVAARSVSGAGRDSERARLAQRAFIQQLNDVFGAGAVTEGEVALYGEDLRPVWFSAERALLEGPAAAGREQALRTGRTVESTVNDTGALRGLVGPARLGVLVVHVPFMMPDSSKGVLDVTYFPEREEQVIDAIRPPMFTLAISAMFIMVIMMQTSMSWVLKLVDDLRKAADAIDAGRLDVRLPAEGQHEIGDLARSLNALIDRLRRRSESQTRFIADASHELATPVAGIRGYANILRAWGADDPDVRSEAISAIDRESRRMARLCGDLLALVRDERGIVYKSERFDLNARSREVLAHAATRYIAKGIEFQGPDEGQLIMVGDSDRVEDALSILVDNAAKYTPDGGRVRVSTRRKRGTVVIEVEDTGIGIPQEDIVNVFDRFYRSDVSRSKQAGFGLGLPIAKSIVEGAGGSIEVRSTAGLGSVFTITLPRGRL